MYDSLKNCIYLFKITRATSAKVLPHNIYNYKTIHDTTAAKNVWDTKRDRVT